ncbi:GTP cyclohydrolase I [Labedaea rhizosphaerae]|uniref:GTP cyclohydrolase 1 n=1 Tax=Labedaea rhizosphaerae TaxID=598644 RepID=A0A4R6SF36_LABRH|nr:GTP cyclohydrolase I [Labedaea rhizosphaerae]
MTNSLSDRSATVSKLRPRLSHAGAPVDLAAAERAAADFLVALGIDVSSEATEDTPRRMAHAFAEMLTVPEFDMTTFPNDQDYDELVVVEGIEFRSLCEHHMLPFTGVAHVGYLPGERILGLSKLARLVAFFAARPQTQERLTKQIADELNRNLAPKGVGVVVMAEHACMSLRGARARNTHTVTSALYGDVRENPALRAEFLSLTKNARTNP